MAKAKLDWSVLRGALGMLGVCALLSIIMLSASFYFRDAMNKEYRRHHNRFMSISSRYLAVDEEERIIRTQYPRFVELYNRGVIGSEDRLSWIEALRLAAEETGIDTLRYNIDSREEFDAEFPVNTRGFALYSSRMFLKLETLHEADLVRLLARLESRAAGLFSVRRCRISRSQTELNLDSLRDNISGSCELDWLTLNRNTEEGIVL